MKSRRLYLFLFCIFWVGCLKESSNSPILKKDDLIGIWRVFLIQNDSNQSTTFYPDTLDTYVEAEFTEERIKIYGCGVTLAHFTYNIMSEDFSLDVEPVTNIEVCYNWWVNNLINCLGPGNKVQVKSDSLSLSRDINEDRLTVKLLKL